MSEARLPPRWFVRAFWQCHRGVVRVTGARVGLWRPKGRRWGALRLTTTGRRSGQPRKVILGYLEDGPHISLLAMNGWAEPEPAWWLNLQEHPVATVDLPGRRRRTMTARAVSGSERERLWDAWKVVDTKLDAYAALRPTETAVVVLEAVDRPTLSRPADAP